MKFLLPLLFLVSTSYLTAQDGGATVRVTVTNIPGVKGNLLVGLFDSASSFTGRPMAVSPKVRVTSTGPHTVEIPNVKPGTYAISVIQDLNGNGKLDKSVVGMPKEPLAFSRIKSIPRGKPKFADCAFPVGEKDVSMTIRLVTQ